VRSELKNRNPQVLEDNLQVSIGGVDCRVTSSNDTAISCDVGPGQPGFAAVSVSVSPSGLAESNAGVLRRFQVDSVEPSLGSLAGTNTLPSL